MIHTMHSTIRTHLKTRLTACCDRCLQSGQKTELKRFKFAGSQLQYRSTIRANGRSQRGHTTFKGTGAKGESQRGHTTFKWGPEFNASLAIVWSDLSLGRVWQTISEKLVEIL